MAEQVDFAALLSQEANTTPPPAVPAGSYVAVVKGHRFDTSPQKGTPFVEFATTLIQPQDDVDEEALKDFGGLDKLRSKVMTLTFYLTPDAMFRLAQFIDESLQIGVEGKPYDELIPETTNQQFIAIVTQTLAKDRKNSYANINDTAAVGA